MAETGTAAAAQAQPRHPAPKSAPPDASPGTGAATREATASGSRLVFTDRATFLWKSGLLLATTVALVPILLWRHELAARIYLWTLVVVHIAGVFVVAVGVRRHQIAPDRRGLYSRLAAIVTLVALLYLASQGLDTRLGGAVFWLSLFAIWALHTLGLVLLHVRSQREQALCPFV